jgi:hypothetical protein
MTLTRPVRAGDTSGMAKSWTFRVKGSSPKLFALTVRAVSELGYSITHSDAASRTVSFETGTSWRTRQGQEMSAAVIANGEIGELVVSGARKGNQLVQWGEKEAIAHKVFNKVLELAPHTADEPPSTTTSPVAPTSVSSELERLAQLHRDQVLTAEEFSAAKAKLLA